MVDRAFHVEYPISQTNHYESYPSSNEQLTDQPQELSVDDNVEGRDGGRSLQS